MGTGIHPPDAIRLRQLDFVDVLVNDVFTNLPPQGWCRLSDDFLANLEFLPVLVMVLFGVRVNPRISFASKIVTSLIRYEWPIL
jgi:hypothetical protein